MGMRARSAIAVALVGLVGASLASARTAHDASSTPTYRGNGGETLPPIRVTAPSTLLWAANGGLFSIFSNADTDGGTVNSTASKGWTYVTPGRYTLQINAIGNWAFRIVRGIEAPQKLSGGLIGYRGNGGLDLPPFRFARSEQVYWTNSGKGGNGGNVSSSSGTCASRRSRLASDPHRGRSATPSCSRSISVSSSRARPIGGSTPW